MGLLTIRNKKIYKSFLDKFYLIISSIYKPRISFIQSSTLCQFFFLDANQGLVLFHHNHNIKKTLDTCTNKSLG